MAAEVVKLQCGLEYFKDDEREPRAAQLQWMSADKLKNLPTENLAAERYLAKFGYLTSISAVTRNKKFKEKRIRDDLMFTKDEAKDDILVSTNNIIKTLNNMEVKWTEEQKKWREKITENIFKKEQT